MNVERDKEKPKIIDQVAEQWFGLVLTHIQFNKQNSSATKEKNKHEKAKRNIQY